MFKKYVTNIILSMFEGIDIENNIDIEDENLTILKEGELDISSYDDDSSELGFGEDPDNDDDIEFDSDEEELI